MTLKDKHKLSYEMINSGIECENQIALSVLNEATDYLGWMLSHLIVSLNPHLIVLDGQMIHQVSHFFEQTVLSTRKYTWVDAWNVTEIVKSQNSPDNLVYGAVYAST